MKNLIFIFCLSISIKSLSAQETILLHNFNDEICYSSTLNEDDSFISFNRTYRYITPGDLIKKSSIYRFTSLGISFTSAIIVSSDIIELKDNKIAFSVFSGVTVLGFYIASEVLLIKAGNIMNKERFNLSPASEGIGLAINF